MYILLRDLHDEPVAKLVKYNEQVYAYIQQHSNIQPNAQIQLTQLSVILCLQQTVNTVRDVQTDTKILGSRRNTGLGLNTHLE